MEENVDFSIRLKELRSSMGMTQKEFSELVGTSSVTLSSYENNTTTPSLDFLKNLAVKCNVSIDWLCGLSSKKNLSNTPPTIETYSDFMKIMFSLEDSQLNFERNILYYEDILDISYKCIGFTDPVIMYLYKSWEKTYSLYKDGTIDKSIYNAWQEKILKDFKQELLLTDNEFSEFYSFYRGEYSVNEYEATISSLLVAKTGAPF